MSNRIVPINIISRLRRIRADNLLTAAAATAESSSDSEPHAGQHNENGRYDPSPIDVAVVRIMLVKATKLPVDVVDYLLDQAEYWVRSSTVANYAGNVQMVPESGIQDKFLLRSLPIGFTAEHGGDLDRTGPPAPPKPLKNQALAKTLARMADYPLPRLLSPVRKIVFKVTAHDQGWSQDGGQGLYENSWTWFEAGLERFERDELDEPHDPPPTPLDAQKLRPVYPLISSNETAAAVQDQEDSDMEDEQQEISSDPPLSWYTFDLLHSAKWTVCRNKRAHGDYQNHEITWTCYDDIRPESDQGKALEDAGRGRETGTGDFVRSLGVGDVVTLWAKARFPGWVNNVQSASIDVYWAAA